MKTNIDLDAKTLTVDGVEYAIKKKQDEPFPEGTIVRVWSWRMGVITNFSTCPHSGEHSYRIIFFDEDKDGTKLKLHILNNDDYGCTLTHAQLTPVILTYKSI